MLSEKKIKELTEYWLEGSKGNFKATQKLYENKQYSECLFFGHLILEKVLKGLVVKKTKNHAPRSHNLAQLAEIGGMEDKETLRFLSKVNDFNMETRYPDEQLRFYKKCNKSFTDQYYSKIISLYKELCQKMK